MFYAAPNFTNVSSILHISVFCLFCVYVCKTRLSRATADNAWLSKQLENESSQPRAFEADDRGKHAYPDSGHQAYPRQWASNSLNYAGGRNFTVSSQVLSRQIVHNTVGSLSLAKNALHSTSYVYAANTLRNNVLL